MGIRGVNYISDLGELQSLSITTPLIFKGKRLVRIQVSGKSQGPFRPSSITLDTPNVINVQLDPITVGNYLNLDFSKLIRATKIGTGWQIKNVIFPESNNLSTISLSGRSTELKFENIPNLSKFDYRPVDRLKDYEKIFIGKNVGTKTNWSIRDFIQEVYNQQALNNVHKLQSVHIEDIDWPDVDAELLDWLSERPTCELYGRIGIAEGTNEYQTAVTWDLKNKFIKKFGDIDTGNGDLTLEYRKRNFEASTAKIKGNFFVDDYIVRDKGYNDVETFDFSVTPESTYMNTQTKIQFSLEGGNTSAYSMSADGKLSVNVYQLSDKQNFATIKAAVTQYENGSLVTENVTKKIEIWNRPAQVGDVVYYDGSYGDYDDYDGTKTIIGICCYLAPKNVDGSIFEGRFDANDIQQRLMLSAYPTEAKVWGITSRGINSGDDLQTYDSNGKELVVTKNGENTQNTPLTRKSQNISGNILTEDNFRSNDDDSLLDDGFAPQESKYAFGDGLSYNESSSEKQGRTITGQNKWEYLLSDFYKRKTGKMVNNGYASTLKIIHHRNGLISPDNDGTSLIDNFTNSDGSRMNISLFKPMKSERVSEQDSLSECITAVQTYFRDEYQSTKPEKWQQLLYPAASSAYAYEPTVKTKEILSEKFVLHNWFLPPIGILARTTWYNIKEQRFKKVLDAGLISLDGSYSSITTANERSYYRFHTTQLRIYEQVNFYGDAVHPMCAF